MKELKSNKQVICADGFSMSVQAAAHVYSHPRADDCEQYTEVEVGFPSAEESLLMPYVENPNNPTDTVYGYVPVGIVTVVIAKHGGMVSGELPAGIPKLRAENFMKATQ
jgi:hypothetical protein